MMDEDLKKRRNEELEALHRMLGDFWRHPFHKLVREHAMEEARDCQEKILGQGLALMDPAMANLLAVRTHYAESMAHGYYWIDAYRRAAGAVRADYEREQRERDERGRDSDLLAQTGKESALDSGDAGVPDGYADPFGSLHP